MRRWIPTALLVLALLPALPAGSCRAATVWAVLVGVDKYDEATSSLRTCVNDVIAFRNLLVEFGVPADNIRMLHTPVAGGPRAEASDPETMPTYANLCKAIQTCFQLDGIKPEDTFIFYYAGHGYREKQTDYIQPCDWNSQTCPQIVIPVSGLAAWADQCRANQVFILLDACRQPRPNSVAATTPRDQGIIFPLPTAAASKPNKDRRVTVIYACEQLQVSQDQLQEDHGSFSYYLNEAVDANPMLTIKDIRDKVFPEVTAFAKTLNPPSRQVPTISWHGSEPDYSVRLLPDMTPSIAQMETGTGSLPYAGKHDKNAKDQAEMVYVPAMEWRLDGVKQAVPAFWIYTHEVTWGQYKLFLSKSRENPPRLRPKQMLDSRDNWPVVNVTWNDALAYARWAGGQLPTEREWEIAATGGSRFRKYPWKPGSEFRRDRANIRTDFPTPVTSYPDDLNEVYGVYGMAGNVREWCERGPFHADAARDSGATAPAKGGSWTSDWPEAVCSGRKWLDKNGRFEDVGFRVVISDEHSPVTKDGSGKAGSK